ncbi:hypothetical protein LSAT2_002080 [Lamellibrachia satsuma]|nr:hypothetical protein LSAT2_002080 [Lamellibrachia satsuma]
MTIYSNNPVFAGHNVGSVQSRYIWPSQMIDVDIDVKRQAGRHPAGHHKEHKGWSAVTGYCVTVLCTDKNVGLVKYDIVVWRGASGYPQGVSPSHAPLIDRLSRVTCLKVSGAGWVAKIVVNDKGQAQKDEFIIPTLAASSIYHEPPSLAALALTESTLLRYHSDMPTIITIGPQPQVESITAQNRFSVLTCLLRSFNADIEHVPLHAHRMLCRMCSKIVRMGFVGESNELAPSRANSSVSASVSMVGSVRDFSESGRVAVTGAFLTELTCGVYHTMYNGQTQRGMLALNDLHQRACFELYSEVILLTNAIKNGLKQSPPGAHKNNPMGISMSSSPHQAGNISKCAITNASFRAKKLPDDIASNMSLDQGGDDHGMDDDHQSKWLQSSSQSSAKSASPLLGGGKHIFFVKRKSRHSTEEDIEVPEFTNLSDNPPRYEDITEQDSMEGKSRHTNPIKSIIKKSDKTKASLNQRHSTLSILSEELNTYTDLSLISLQMSEGDAPPRRLGKEITLDVLSHRHRQETPHKRTCGFPDKSCCCASTALTEKLSDSYVALVDGKSGNGPQRRGYESTFSDSGNPDSLSTQL